MEVFPGHLECWGAVFDFCPPGRSLPEVAETGEYGLSKFDASSSSHPTKSPEQRVGTSQQNSLVLKVKDCPNKCRSDEIMDPRASNKRTAGMRGTFLLHSFRLHYYCNSCGI